MTLVNFKNGNRLAHFPVFDRAFGLPSIFSETLGKMWAEEDVQWMPSANITERAGDYKIDLAVPGMEKKNFRVEVDNGILKVSGERVEENIAEDEKVTRREFHYGTFSRSFSLPETANQEQITASYNNGVLSLLVAKKDESKQKAKKTIEID